MPLVKLNDETIPQGGSCQCKPYGRNKWAAAILRSVAWGLLVAYTVRNLERCFALPLKELTLWCSGFQYSIFEVVPDLCGLSKPAVSMLDVQSLDDSGDDDD